MNPRFIDTHLHLVYRDRLGYPWLSGAPALNQDFPLPRYQTEALRCGITDAIHMEVDVAPADIEAETRNVEALGHEAGEFPAFLERQLADPFVKGFRRVLHVAPDELSEAPAFRANLRGLAGS